MITGAGISAESGVPTYRGKGGLYDDPEEGDRTIEALSADTLARDPDRTWAVLTELARTAQTTGPNAAHRALVEMETTVDNFVLLTQNVDGLHRRAGTRNLIEIHGHVFDTVCPGCGAHDALADLSGLMSAPRCSCGALLKPDVVLFGDLLPVQPVARMREAFYETVADLIIVVGTSAMFPYISDPVLIARDRGKLTIEINPEPSPLSKVVDFWLRGPAGHVLPMIVSALQAQRIDVVDR